MVGRCVYSSPRKVRGDDDDDDAQRRREFPTTLRWFVEPLHRRCIHLRACPTLAERLCHRKRGGAYMYDAFVHMCSRTPSSVYCTCLPATVYGGNFCGLLVASPPPKHPMLWISGLPPTSAPNSFAGLRHTATYVMILSYMVYMVGGYITLTTFLRLCRQ